MFDILYNDHLKTIKKLDTPRLIVYKGFPTRFLSKISKEIPFVTQINQINKGKIDLNEIIKSKKELIKQYISVDDLKISTYEEFIFISRNINPEILDYKITIIHNDLFQGWFPNSSNYLFPDQNEEIELKNNFNPDKIFNYFYSNSKIINNTNYISYLDVDTNDFQLIDEKLFFEGFVDGEELVLVDSDVIENAIELPSPDDTFTIIKTDFFNNTQKSKYEFLISENTKHFENAIIKKELLILSTIAKHKNIDCVIYKTNEELSKPDIRADFKIILKNVWNSADFRKLKFYKDPAVSNEIIEIDQDQIIEDLVKQSELANEGKNYRDIFITAPTGAGKSVLFQIPGIYLDKYHKAVTIVVSPLKALMYDQVISLKEKGVESACYINSDISFIKRQETIDDLKEGRKSILYLSPELLLSYSISEFIGDRLIGLLVIDEAHLVSTWGRDFRVDYWYLGKYIRSIRKYSQQHFPIVALTATAVYGGKNDTVFETIESLNMRLPKLYIGNVKRVEIEFNIRTFKYKGTHEEEKINNTKKKIEKNISSKIKTISYFPWTRQIETIFNHIDPELNQYLGKYYGSVDQYERQDVIEKFKNGEIRCVLATKAFGMGVDISDITEIYHHAPSGSLSDYVQEIGRVARDKTLKGKAVVDFTNNDLKFTKILYGLSSVKFFQIKLVLQKVYNLYILKKKQNILVSVEDFQYIFPNVDLSSLNSKVKSTLLLIENDFLEKFGYYVILVRPKSLYTTVFAEVPKKAEKRFLSNYQRYCKKLKKPELNDGIKINTFDGLTITRPGTKNNFYQLELDKIWEKHFSDESFPRVKKRFFDRELFFEDEDDNPIPLNKLSVTLNKDISESYALLEYFWELLIIAFENLSGHFFELKDLERLLKVSINDRILRKRICDLVLNIYSSRITFIDNSLKATSSKSFLQMKTVNYTPKYRVMNKRFYTVAKQMKRQFSTMFCLGKPYFEKYIGHKSPIAEEYINLVHQLESFRIGSYEFTGGMLPMIFIRINDPYKIRMASNDEGYNNNILQNINERQVSSMNIMEYFFTKDLDRDKRWSFIENYFLGRDETDLFELTNK